MSGETGLWAAVLYRAREDLKDSKELESARYWFKNRKNKGIGSFLWICGVLDYDPDKTRNKILSRV